ncbi:glycosyltransferase family 1 protein [Robertkochia marina]|uniref:Glycosyltransferase family 1 protein n=1 Tax=Robertkochia marina TaxID=1227945 RepID=A0A4S3M2A5_9FLAO|nr:glycosyltransferase family 1 protein [Robertkochia marina]THD67729.1 glycosyltransferase family 1 protein [Robertkochia marina]TRZ40944.1 glycosyltransferase family 1 protein [Robertkochia marina]
MRKIAIDARMLNHSGIGKYLKTILGHLVNEKQIALSLLVYKEQIGFFGSGPDYIVVKSSIYSIQEQLELFLKIPRCDVFWSPHFNIPLLPLKCLTRVVTIHDTYHLRFLNELSLLKRIYSKLFYKMAVMKSDHIITVSQWSKSEIIKYTGCKKEVKKIYNGGPQYQKNNGTVKKQLLFVGNIKPHKNIDNAIKAFINIKNNNPSLGDYKFIIVGNLDNDKYGMKITNMCKTRNDVVLTGRVNDQTLLDLYSTSEWFIMPSIYEGFGLPVLESFSKGLPVLSSNAASIPEVGGKAVIYFNPNSVDDIGEKMMDAINRPEIRDSLIEKGKERLKLFTWDKTIKAHKNILLGIGKHEDKNISIG